MFLIFKYTIGVLSIALPVPVVVSNFETFYQKELNRRRQEQDKKEEDKKKAKEEKNSPKSSNDNLEEDERSMMRNGDDRDLSSSPTNV